ncbi:hypothetical protein [Synoicihabitans lomoniglobus]|uniref:Uncharacterized protein n=1 Tax=Synoicihabitans lomoniglobus TaxID=2909285 RepID=A0AAF0I7W2_9BACT|nr:hypothetical protein [Opitutaceae bacterium LMO-M01]WED67066.1 hypothetical protein PXH66_09405 [Opitutaceae bacterium LMO-M01]
MNFRSNSRRPTSRQDRAFSLFELVIATGLFSFITIGSTSVMLQSMNSYHYDIGKLLVNRDIRTFTSEMTSNASYANYFMVFPSYGERSMTVEIGDSSSGISEVTTDASVNDGKSGDFLLLVYTSPDDSAIITRLVGYFRSPLDPESADSEGPVRRFDTSFPDGITGNIWELLPPVEDAATEPEVIELSQGLADGKLFYNFRNRSVMVKGKIFHEGNLMRRATNTYNFTVSPRG